MHRFIRPAAAMAIALTLAGVALAQSGPQPAPSGQLGRSCPGCDLLQADLSFRDLSGRTFAGARLMQADMTASLADRVNFSRANLRFLEAAGARFTRADFSSADLAQATLVGAYLGYARFTGASLAGANLSGAELTGAIGLTQAQLNLACGDGSTLLPAGLTVPVCE